MRKDKRIIFVIPHNQYYQVVEWCIENFGPKHRKRWKHNYKSDWKNNFKVAADIKPITFYINTREDAMAFKLRWI